MEIVLSLVGTAAGVAAVVVAVIQLRGMPRGRDAPGGEGPSEQVGGPAPGPAVGPGGEAVRRVGALGVPTGRLPEVRGRSGLIEELRSALPDPDGRFRVLAGLGGVGKTTVALALAETVRDEGHPVWWLSAVDNSSLSDGFLELALELGAPQTEVEDARAGRANPADLVWQYLDSRRRWLLVIDNADDLSALTVAGAEARDGTGWLRPTSAGLIVVTSRVSDRSAWGRHGQVLRLGSLSAADGARVLMDHAPHAGTREEAERLAERLGGLPLGLLQAGAFLASPFALPSSFSGYRRELAERFAELMGAPDGSRSSVTATWEISLDALEARGIGQARALLRVLAFFAPSVEIPTDLLDRDVLGEVCGEHGAAAVQPGLDALLSTGLIEHRARDAGSAAVVVHPLVAAASRLGLSPDTTRAATVLLNRAMRPLRPDDPDHWPSWLALLPHLRAMVAPPSAPFDETGLVALARSGDRAGAMLLWAGQNHESETLVRAALERAGALDPDHRAHLTLRFRLADAWRIQGRHHEAQSLFQEVLEGQSRTLGPDHPDTLSTRNNIAWTNAAHGHLVEAESRYRAVLDDRLRVLGPDHPETLATRYNIAWTISVQGRTAEAETLLRAVLDDRLRVLGPDHPDTLTTRHDIARAIAAQNRQHEAETLFRSILDDRLRVLGADHPDTVSTRNEIARAVAEQGGAAEAEALFRTVLDDRRRVLGADHPSTLSARNCIAWTVALQGRHEEAERAFRAVSGDQRRALGDDNPRLLATLHQLAWVLAEQGRLAEAEALFDQVLSARRRVLNPDHPDIRATAEALAGVRDRIPDERAPRH